MQTAMEQTVLNKIAGLPENLQSEVADFVDFLIHKYHLEKVTDGENLTDEQKQTIRNRYEQLNQNPGRGLDWDDAKAKLMLKHA